MARGPGKPSPIDVAKCLNGLDFPAVRADLFDLAEENGAGEEVLERIRRMPDREYGGMAEVMKGLGEAG